MLIDHNKEAYEATKNMLLKHHECCFVAAPGIGKSNVAVEIVQEFGLNALIIAPRVSIRDNWAHMPDKYDFPPTISVVTYQFFTKHYKHLYGFDIYIFDEAHHAGANKWGKAIRKFRDGLNSEFILGLTADPNRYFDAGVNKSVIDTVFNGHAVYGYDQKSAINDGILPKATYVCAIFDTEGLFETYEKKEMTDELRGRLNYTKANCSTIQDIIHSNIPANTPIKGIVFVDSIKNVSVGIELIKRSFPKETVCCIHSKQNADDNKYTLELFRNMKSGFIVAVNMLNEGLHIKGINTIIMLRKTSSPSVYIQQIGRGLAIDGKNVTIFDFVRNDTSVKKVLARIHSIENEIKPEIDSYEIHSNKVSNRHIAISDQSIIKDYTTDILAVLNDIDAYVKTINSDTWTPEEDEIIINYYPTMGYNVYKLLPNRTKYACSIRANKLGIMSDRSWTSEEDEILKIYYSSNLDMALKILTKRNRYSCYARASVLGITNSTTDPWTPKEIEILIKNYPTMGNDVCELLPGRTKEAILSKARKLNIKTERAWTQKEIEILTENYFIMGKDVCKLLPGRNIQACRHKISKMGLTNRPNRKWTPQEDRIIKDNYPIMGKDVCKLLPGRTEQACMSRASKFQLDKIGIKWTSEEDQLIRDNYPTMGRDVYKLLPNRTQEGCRARAKTLNIKFGNHVRWTPEEDKIIRENYSTMGKDVCKLLPGRNMRQCYARAHTLGIKYQKNKQNK